MAFGPGKYDGLCTLVREQTKATGGVILIVLGGELGEGFSAQLTAEAQLKIPSILRRVADQIERMRKET